MCGFINLPEQTEQGGRYQHHLSVLQTPKGKDSHVKGTCPEP